MGPTSVTYLCYVALLIVYSVSSTDWDGDGWGQNTVQYIFKERDDNSVIIVFDGIQAEKVDADKKVKLRSAVASAVTSYCSQNEDECQNSPITAINSTFQDVLWKKEYPVTRKENMALFSIYVRYPTYMDGNGDNKALIPLEALKRSIERNKGSIGNSLGAEVAFILIFDWKKDLEACGIALTVFLCFCCTALITCFCGGKKKRDIMDLWLLKKIEKSILKKSSSEDVDEPPIAVRTIQNPREQVIEDEHESNLSINTNQVNTKTTPLVGDSRLPTSSKKLWEEKPRLDGGHVLPPAKNSGARGHSDMPTINGHLANGQQRCVEMRLMTNKNKTTTMPCEVGRNEHDLEEEALKRKKHKKKKKQNEVESSTTSNGVCKIGEEVNNSSGVVNSDALSTHKRKESNSSDKKQLIGEEQDRLSTPNGCPEFTDSDEEINKSMSSFNSQNYQPYFPPISARNI